MPATLYPSMGLVAKFLDVHAKRYVMATSMVFFCDHVSALLHDGKGYQDRVRNANILTPNLIPNEMGPARNLGSGKP